MFEIKIEKNIPIKNQKPKNSLTKTMQDMEIGDSFLYPSKSKNSLPSLASRIGVKIVTRKHDDNYHRIWRVE